VREPASLEALAAIGIPATLGFDCLPLYVRHSYQNPDRDKAHDILVAGSVAFGPDTCVAIDEYCRHMLGRGFRVKILIGARHNIAQDDLRFVSSLKASVQAGASLVNASTEHEWLTTIAASRLLVSGRFHHSIAASCFGVPCILLDSNTKKTDGLAQTLETIVRIGMNAPDLSRKLLGESETILTQQHDTQPSQFESLCDLALRNFH
jgi:polysaccharide pyruvyl transferase WcaK-like protein